MFPAADEKSVWDMAPAGFSSGGFFTPGAGFASGDLANWHKPAKVGIEVGIV
jgi:hypothetical protein